MSRDCPSRSVLRRAFQPCGLLRLLRHLLTSRSGSSPSPFQAQDEISPGKNAILHRTTAAFTSPAPWPQELRRSLPARPGQRRLGCGSCTSAHGLRSSLPPHARSPSRNCDSLASLWPARPGTSTPKIAPMLGAQLKRPGRAGPFVGHAGLSLPPYHWRGTTPYCGLSLNLTALLDQLLAPVTLPYAAHAPEAPWSTAYDSAVIK